MRAIDIIFLLLPILLWPITFIVLKSVFIYSMFVSTLILALISLYYYKGMIRWRVRSYPVTLAIGVIGAIALYLIFYLGNYLTIYLGINGLVSNVYAMIYADVPRIPLAVLLIFIGLFEEIYWRGALQGFIRGSGSRVLASTPWVLTTLYYASVHISTLNIVLVGAAFFVGLVTSIIADRYGIISSMITHIVWIELIVLIIPIL
ncbi:MAG: CPBP family intramembrane metalloprotease [Candidatus Marsarchaeota archaeon]|jgi:membrane protease YdiL (CAAX protease family)|nr:CPBP family intramembrane metalloprotease [Candidatus Marsarchaeota archaeon]